MIISPVQHQIKGSRIKVWVELTSKRGSRQRLFFRISRSFANFLALDATPFISGLLLPCARHHKNIQTTCEVSSKWYRNIQRIMHRVATWQIGLSPIAVQVATTKPDAYQAANVGLFFSAGVDSFSTYLKYKQSKRYPITHFIFVQGFDIDIQNTRLYLKMCRKIRRIAKQEGITCITVKTNLRAITDQWLNWEMAHGGALAAVALLLRRGFKTILIPGSGYAALEEPWGSSSKLDYLWSTETLELVHDLDHRTRLSKVHDFIAPSPLALRYLRVCWKNQDENCCLCAKCLATMVELRIARVLDQARSFTKPLDLTLVSTLFTTPYTVSGQIEDAIKHLETTGKDPELLEALKKSQTLSTHPSIKRRFKTWVHDVDLKYNESRLYLFLSKRGMMQ